MEGTRPGYSGGTGVRNAAASPPSPPPPSTSHGNVLKAKVQKKQLYSAQRCWLAQQAGPKPGTVSFLTSHYALEVFLW